MSFMHVLTASLLILMSIIINAEIEVVPNVPLVMSVEFGQEIQCRLNIPDMTSARAVAFAMSLVTGNAVLSIPGLYVFTFGLRIYTEGFWTNQSEWRPIVRAQSLNTTVILLATVMKSVNDTDVIIPFRPSLGAASVAGTTYFTYEVTQPARSLVITAESVSSARITVFVNRNSLNTSNNRLRLPWLNGSDYQSTELGPDEIIIPNATPGIYVIAITATETAGWLLRAILSDEVTTLLEGISLWDAAYFNTTRCYVFDYYQQQNNANRSITVSLRSNYAGNADLFVSTLRFPTNIDYQWRSILSDSNELITIKYDDRNYCANCRYYATVFGHSTVTYSITVSSSNRVQMSQGIPYYTVLAYGAYFYVYAPSSLHSDVQFTVTNEFSSSERFDSRYLNVYFSPDHQFPAASYSNISVGPTTEPVIIILVPTSSPLSCLSRNITLAECRYYFSVSPYYGYGSVLNAMVMEDVQLTPLTLNGGTTSLQLVLSERYNYYFVYVTDGIPNGYLSIGLNSISNDCDLFVSKTASRPSDSDFEWSSTLFGSDSIGIPNATVGPYYISVLNRNDVTAAYTLTTQLFSPRNPASTIGFVNPLASFRAIVPAGSSRYFQLNNERFGNSGVLTIFSRFGNGMQSFVRGPFLHSSQMIWSNRSTDSIAPLHSNPSYTSYYLEKTQNEIAAFYSLNIYVPSSSSDAIVDIMFHIAYTSFRISNGQAIYGLLQQVSSPDQYIIPIASSQAYLMINLQTIKGDADLYVGNRPWPTVTNHLWNSTSYGTAGDFIIVSNLSAPLNSYAYYCTVYAKTPGTEYTLSVFYGSHRTLVTGDGGNTFLITTGATAIYDFFLPGNTTFTLSIHIDNGVATQYFIDFGQTPTIYEYKWSLQTTNDQAKQSLVISEGLCPLSTCRYLILAVPDDHKTVVGSIKITTGSSSNDNPQAEQGSPGEIIIALSIIIPFLVVIALLSYYYYYRKHNNGQAGSDNHGLYQRFIESNNRSNKQKLVTTEETELSSNYQPPQLQKSS